MELKIFTEHESVFNHYVATHPRGDVLQTTHWGKLKATTGWEYYPLAIMDKGQIRASALILSRKLPLPGTCLFYSPRGPLYSDLTALRELISAVREFAHKHRALFWKMDPAIIAGDPEWSEIAPELHYNDTGLNFDSIQPKFIMELDIRPSLDKILEGMKNKTRYNIRYAERKEIKVVLSQNKEDLQVFYPILQETAERDNFTVRSFAYFENLWDCLVTPKLAQLFLAYHKDQPLSGAIAFRLGKRAWYVYGASSNEKRNLQPTYAIQWEMIKWAKGSGCHIYDFRGVSGDLNPENPLYGLYRFKEGFGAKLVEYVGEYDLPFSRMGYALWRTAFPFYQRITNNH